MSAAAPVVTNAPDSPIVQIDRALFARIEDQQKRVGETDRALKNAAEEHKEAKKAHEAATDTLTGLVAILVRRVNGEPDGPPLPLFDSQTDAIDAATNNPVVSALIDRMLGHGLTQVNALIVAGYDEEQRRELTLYLDALDARVQVEAARANAEADGQTEDLPEVPDMPELPAFLQPQEFPEVTDQDVVDALSSRSVEMKKKHIRQMSQDQRRDVLAWSAACAEVTERLGEALTFDDLPPAPSFVISPKELEAIQEEPDAAPAEEAETPKKSRAPRRSSKEFKNTPRLAGRAKKAKGKNRPKEQAAEGGR